MKVQIQTITLAYLDAARFRKAWDSLCSRRHLLRRKSLGPVHSEQPQVAAALVNQGWLKRHGRTRQRRHARFVMLPLPWARHIRHSRRRALSKVFLAEPRWPYLLRCFL